MLNSITVGKRLIAKERIAFVEPYDPNANPGFQTSRDFKGRVVMLYPRESILTENSPEAFAEAHDFRMLELDQVAINPAIHYRVETFVPSDNFTPPKPYATRLLWRDLDGNDQSKLLLSDPETVLAVAVRGNADAYGVPRPSRRKNSAAALAAHAPEH